MVKKLKKAVFAYGLSSPLSQTVLEGLARFDVVVTEFAVGPDINKLKALNPGIQVLGYRSIMAMQPTYPDWAEVDTHEDWFVHDSNGNRLRISWPSGWYCMDIHSSGWVSHLVNKIIGESSGFDGIFVDNTWDIFMRNVWTVDSSLVPDVPAETWQGFMGQFLAYIKSQTNLGVIYNGKSLAYINNTDGLGIEDFGSKAEHVQMVEDAGLAGKYCIVIAKGANEEACKFYFAAFLLGVEGDKNYFAWWNSPFQYSVMDIDHGVAGGSRFELEANVFTREFANVQVYVNASANPYMFTFEGQEYIIQPDTAMILNYPVEEPEPPPPGCITAFLLTGAGLSGVLPFLRLFRSRLPKLITRGYYTVSDVIMRWIPRR